MFENIYNTYLLSLRASSNYRYKFVCRRPSTSNNAPTDMTSSGSANFMAAAHPHVRGVTSTSTLTSNPGNLASGSSTVQGGSNLYLQKMRNNSGGLLPHSEYSENTGWCVTSRYVQSSITGKRYNTRPSGTVALPSSPDTLLFPSAFFSTE